MVVLRVPYSVAAGVTLVELYTDHPRVTVARVTSVVVVPTLTPPNIATINMDLKVHVQVRKMVVVKMLVMMITEVEHSSSKVPAVLLLLLT